MTDVDPSTPAYLDAVLKSLSNGISRGSAADPVMATADFIGSPVADEPTATGLEPVADGDEPVRFTGVGAPGENQTMLDQIIATAQSALGTPYKFGGNSLKSGIDCSALIQKAYKAAGISLPRVSADQAKAGQEIAYEDAQPGDLLWYDNSTRNNGADHIALYLGHGMMIEAPRTGEVVRATKVRQPTGVTRILGVVAPRGES